MNELLVYLRINARDLPGFCIQQPTDILNASLNLGVDGNTLFSSTNVFPFTHRFRVIDPCTALDSASSL